MKRLLVSFLILSQVLFSCDTVKTPKELETIANGIFEEVFEKYATAFLWHNTAKYCGIDKLFPNPSPDGMVMAFVTERVNNEKLSKKDSEYISMVVKAKYSGFQKGVTFQRFFTGQMLKMLDLDYCDIPTQIGEERIRKSIK